MKKFHKEQMPKMEWMIEMHPGVYAGEKIEPIDTVALYVPRGKGKFENRFHPNKKCLFHNSNIGVVYSNWPKFLYYLGSICRSKTLQEARG